MNSIYEVELSKEAVKFIKKLDKPTASRIINSIESLKNNPREHSQAKELKGFIGDFYRLRVGNFRVVYEVIDSRLIISVVKVGPRGDVYKHL